ncbi:MULTISPECIES: hypothetical protein [unclassified Streptomyces]
MASIKPRKRANGEITYTIVWRTGGTRDGAWNNENFDDEELAKRFREVSP